ncbi:SGNH/GDSL hydrolase family protein [Rhodococcus globerulus]|nr:SGNH/GDSL hydrolase family protein [Rhodococcus globerulus]NMD59901.1 SGNH/GDSL hydrolase family protein [Nocardia globerula]
MNELPGMKRCGMPESHKPRNARSEKRDPKTLAFGAFLVVALIAGAGMYWLSESRGSHVSNASTESSTPLKFGPEGSENPWVYFIGDAYTVGSPMDSGTQWPDMIASNKKWFVRDLGVDLSGYLQKGIDGKTYLERINNSSLQDADMVVISGGLNDVHRTAEHLIQPAVHETLTRARELVPDVPIAVVSVLAPGREPKINRMNAILKSEALLIGATYLDATSVLTNAQGSIGTDNMNPTDAGHRLLAESIGPRLPAPKVQQSK